MRTGSYLESESNLPAVPQQTLQVQTTSHVEDVEGIDSEKCDLFGLDHTIGTHELVMGDSHYQLPRQLCDERVIDQATLGLGLDESFHGDGRDLHSVTESNAIGNHYNGSTNSQDKSHYLTTANCRDHAKQRSDLYTAAEYAFSTEDIEDNYHKRLTVEEETSSSIPSVVKRSSKCQKRSHRSSVDDTITTLEAVPNVVLDLELDHSHPSKRQRMAERQVLSPIIEPTYTPEPTPLHLCDQASDISTSDGYIASPPSAGHEEDCTISLALPLIDFCDEEHRDGTHVQGTVKERRQAQEHIALPKGLNLGENVNRGSGRRGVSRKGSSSKNREVYGKKSSHSEACDIPLSRSSPRSHRAWTPDIGRRPSNTALRNLDYNAVPTKPPQQIELSQPQQDSILERFDINTEPQACFPGSNPPGATAEDVINVNYRSGFSMSCQITDLTLCAIPNDSSVVSVILRHCDPGSLLDLVALGHKILGEQGKIIRMTQLSPDSWVLLGYRCNSSGADLCNRGGSKANWMSSAYDDVASHGTDRSKDGYDEEDENEEEDARGHSKRTHTKWRKSEELLLLSLKDEQGMEWEEIYQRFPNRSKGAVKLRYYTLKKQS
ncbi:uncharacterized protein SETTUDRAFT_166763 [Exserohilum turcica Et28A]|uniref:Myb-like domain-containing protein n=1 Tax=Exserohilum turcicum (strain 28A) TaxID=671987 RepID=R0J1K9_EXST2|nr:uncharacterized protein SETTUDRAFT_166763 [Exserohilum turcica Et28A]EOA90870.1 hypothetical protein SETTUDRAFT_166763 [Exserohilum turcica Et28A]